MFTFRRIRSVNRDLSQVQDNVSDVFTKLSLVPLLDGALITNIIFTGSGSLAISHTLGRQPLGWFLVDNNANVTVYRSGWDNRTITLTSSGAATISIWCF